MEYCDNSVYSDEYTKIKQIMSNAAETNGKSIVEETVNSNISISDVINPILLNEHNSVDISIQSSNNYIPNVEEFIEIENPKELSIYKHSKNSKGILKTVSIIKKRKKNHPRVVKKSKNKKSLNSDQSKSSFGVNLSPHLKIDSVHACKFCKRRFKQESDLVSHLKTHTGDKPYTCKICQKGFSLRNSLNYHIKSHMCDKPWACNICHFKFPKKSALLSHIRTHTGEKPFKCDFCQRAFSHKGSLNSHIKTHTGDKQYTCVICHDKFIKNSALLRHIRIHTGEKPFICVVCQKGFSQKCSLNSHIKTHTGEKPFSCDFCGKAFSQRVHLNNHKKTHTGSEIVQF